MHPDHSPTPASGSAAHPLPPGRHERELSPTDEDEAEAAVAHPASIPVVARLKGGDGEGDIDGGDQAAAPLHHTHEEAVPPPGTAPAPHPRPRQLLRILVVADVDLRSAAQLAEFAIRDRGDFAADDPHANKAKGGGGERRRGVDLCVACGPFSPIPYDDVWNSDEEGDDCDRRPEGGARPDDDDNADDEREGARVRRLREACRERWRTASSDSYPGLPSVAAAAAEGGATCVLSQLETIVCRVAFCPSAEVDPPRMTSTRSMAVGTGTGTGTTERVSYERRYTPNSRNVHGRWLQLSPGLGVAGFSSPSPGDDGDGEEGDDCWDASSGGGGGGGGIHRQHRRRRGKLDKREDWTDQGCSFDGKHDASETRYESKIRGLLALAPPHALKSPTLQPNYDADQSPLSQAILVTPFGFTPDDRCSPDTQLDVEMTCDPPSSRCPAPHDRLLQSGSCREQVLLSIVTSLSLEGGGGAEEQFECESSGGVRVISPGSLRGRGEFAIVDVAMCDEGDDPKDDEPTVDAPPPLRKWRVQKVKFRSMENERRFYSW